MIDIGALATGLTFARDAFQVMLGSKIEIETQTRILEALTKLGAAQDTLFQVREELFRLQGENDHLRQELAARNDWEAQKAQYHLTTTAGGGQVRFSDGPPPHYACPACFSNKIIHILQDLGTMGGGFQCPGCKSIFKVNPRRDR